MIWIFAASIFLLDQLTKVYVDSFSGLGFWFCKISEKTLNEGGVFSLPLSNFVLIFLTIFLIVFVLIWQAKKTFKNKMFRIGSGLILGGALGNLLDRFYYGGVVDFIKCGFWPVFNLADVAIVVGVFILIFFGEKKKGFEKK